MPFFFNINLIILNIYNYKFTYFLKNVLIIGNICTLYYIKIFIYYKINIIINECINTIIFLNIKFIQQNP